MKQINASGAELAPLFRLSRDAVCGISHGRIVFANPAACRLFGADVTGEAAESRFPGMTEEDWGECYAASAAVGGAVRDVTAVRFGDTAVLTVRSEEPAVPSVPPSTLRQIRSAALNLRLSIDRLTESREEADGVYPAVLFRSYFSLLHLTSQLADSSALLSGDLPCRMQTLPVTTLVGELTDSVAFFLGDKSVSLRCDLPEDDLFVTGDRERLEQLLLILLGSSIRRIGVPGEISVRVKKVGKNCRISVFDDGDGIPEGELAEVFSARREDTITGAPDTGLDFSIARGLAQLHGGLLVIQSTADGKTSVHVQLPLTGTLTLRDADTGEHGPERILTELCDVLPLEAYKRKYRE